MAGIRDSPTEAGLDADPLNNRPLPGMVWWRTGIVVARTAVFSVLWLAVFLAAFTGYLTVPAIVLAVFLILYGIQHLLVGRSKGGSHSAE